MSSETADVLSPDDERALVTELARLVVATTAADEEVIFDDTAREYFEDPETALRPPTTRDEGGGFGGVLEVLLTPCVLAVATSVIRYLVDVVLEATKAEARVRLVALVRRIFTSAGAPAADERVALSAAQLQRVWQLVFDRAVDLSVDRPRAQLLADSVAGRLAGATPPRSAEAQ